MRPITRAAVITAASIPLVLAAPATAFAADPTDVSYTFSVDGSTLTNTVTNNSGGALNCTTSLAPAPGGERPPVSELNGQSLYEGGEVPTGVTSQSVTEIPDGTYVALATCVDVDPSGPLWVSDYPGIDEVLALFPNESFAVGETSPIITFPAQNDAPAAGRQAVPTEEPAPSGGLLPTLQGILADLLQLFGTGSAS
ncbi:MAG: hypothetical protein WBQ44_10375 [Rhodococcus sp. (in: high G+C Gram-positive bacteria)]